VHAELAGGGRAAVDRLAGQLSPEVHVGDLRTLPEQGGQFPDRGVRVPQLERAGSAIAPISSPGTCSGTGVTRTAGSWKRLPVNRSFRPDQAWRISATLSSSRLGRFRTLRPNAANSGAQ
jgi:hypothetical protein